MCITTTTFTTRKYVLKLIHRIKWYNLCKLWRVYGISASVIWLSLFHRWRSRVLDKFTKQTEYIASEWQEWGILTRDSLTTTCKVFFLVKPLETFIGILAKTEKALCVTSLRLLWQSKPGKLKTRERYSFMFCKLEKSALKLLAGLVFSEGSAEKSVPCLPPGFRWWSIILGIPWLLDALFHTLPLSLHGFSLCLCVFTCTKFL